MLRLELATSAEPLNILCLGAHSDDIEIGCGGTVLHLLTKRAVVVRWVVFGCSGQRADEAKRSAELFLDRARDKQIDVHGFRDAYFPHAGAQIKDAFERIKQQSSPDVIFTHTRHDLHQDHRLVNELTWNTFRDHLILEYEIPKYDGDLRSPNVFVDIDASVADKKIGHLMTIFATQRDKRWFDEETFRGLMRIRGIESGARYAEAFYCRKVVVR